MIISGELVGMSYALGVAVIVVISLERLKSTIQKRLTERSKTEKELLEKNNLEKQQRQFFQHIPPQILQAYHSYPSAAVQLLLNRSYGFSVADSILIQLGLDWYVPRLYPIRTGYIKELLANLKGQSELSTITTLDLPKEKWADMKQSLQLIVSAIESNYHSTVVEQEKTGMRRIDLTPTEYGIWQHFSKAHQAEVVREKTGRPTSPYQAVIFLDIEKEIPSQPLETIAEILSQQHASEQLQQVMIVYLYDNPQTREERLKQLALALKANLKKHYPAFQRVPLSFINASEPKKSLLAQTVKNKLQTLKTQELLLIHYPEQQVFKSYLEQMGLNARIFSAHMPPASTPENALSRWLETLSQIFRLKDSTHRKMYREIYQHKLSAPMFFSNGQKPKQKRKSIANTI